MRKIVAIAASVVLMFASSVTPANAGQYYTCRKGTHTIGTSNFNTALYYANRGYSCNIPIWGG